MARSSRSSPSFGGRSKGRIELPIKVYANGSGLQPLIDRLTLVTRNRKLLRDALRRAVARSFLLQIRQRFIERLRNALEMHVLYEDNKQRSAPKARMNRLKQRRRLENLYAALTEAELSGDKRRANRIRRSSIPKAKDALFAMLQWNQDTTLKAPHKLSQINGVGTMRRLSMAILDYMTSAQMLAMIEDKESLTVGIGYVPEIEKVETPSATPKLTGKATMSQYRVLWRHLEFGTGIHRKDARNPAGGRVGNPGPYGGGKYGNTVGRTKSGLTIKQGAPKRAWFYGTSLTNGLLLAGTRPMNFLFDGSGQPIPQYWAAFEEQFNIEMERVLSL